MFESEFMKSMNLNYERVRLEEKPEEKRYQYCIIKRGGIQGFLPCSLRYINGEAFLYYDITSKQRLSQIFSKRNIDRQWIKDFAWNIKRIRQEASRFLLDEQNIIWYPEQVYQDLEDSRLCFIYYPYFQENNGFKELLEFIVEKLDYKDEKLVNCVYKIYEQYESIGDDYLNEKIHKDILVLNELPGENAELHSGDTKESFSDEYEEITPNFKSEYPNAEFSRGVTETDTEHLTFQTTSAKFEQGTAGTNGEFENAKGEFAVQEKKNAGGKKGLLSFLGGSHSVKKKKNTTYSFENTTEAMVAEDKEFYGVAKDEDYGKTVYIENVAEKKDETKRLYDNEGRVIAVLGAESIVIGKRKEDADVIISDQTVSRVHARISKEENYYYIEDLNSTNGTFKNGLRMDPYERRKLSEEDEIKLGNIELVFK